MKNLKYIILSVFACLSLSSCDLLLPGSIVNPNVSDDTFLESDNAMQAWVNGANRSFAVAMGNYCMLMEILSDNYFNNYSRSSQVFDIPRILYTDTDVADLQRYVGMLRETADYGLGPVADADPATTQEDLFNLYYIKAFSFILGGEHFRGLPDTEGGEIKTWQEYLHTALEVLDRTLEYAGTDEEKVHRLTQATSENRDNHTAIIVHIMEVIDPIEGKKPTPAKAPSAPTPIMAEVHDEDEEDIQEPVPEKGTIAEEKKPMPAHSSAPLPPAKPQRKSRAFLYFIIALIAAFAIAFFLVYFLVLNKGEEKGKTDAQEPVQTEEKVEAKREEVQVRNEPKKPDGEKEPEATVPEKVQSATEEVTVQAPISTPAPEESSVSDEEAADVVESDQDKIEKITENNK